MRMRTVLAASALLSTLGATRAAVASYPAGVWVKVQSVVFEPSPATATKILIQGAAMIYDGSTGTTYLGYTEPALGSLYYECPKGDEATCLQEWQDIQKNIAEPNNVCVGLGDQKLPTGTLHQPGAHPQKADTYPIALGVLPGFVPCEILSSFLGGSLDGGAGASGAAGTTANGGSAGASSGGAFGSGGASGSGGSTSSGGSAGSGAAGSRGGSDDSGGGGGCSIALGQPASLGWSALVGAMLLALRRRKRS